MLKKLWGREVRLSVQLSSVPQWSSRKELYPTEMGVMGARWLTWLAGSPGREKPVVLSTDASGQRSTVRHTQARQDSWLGFTLPVG